MSNSLKFSKLFYTVFLSIGAFALLVNLDVSTLLVNDAQKMMLSKAKKCSLPNSSINFPENSPKDIELHIVPEQGAKWAVNMKGAIQDGQSNKYENLQKRLHDKYKKFFKTDVIIKNTKNQWQCFLKGKMRLTGDFLDHIDEERGVASVKVELNNGAVFGAQDFKLFLHHSKYNEVVVNYLAEKTGFLAPKTLNISVSVLGTNPIKMYFQEDLNADFLQRTAQREGPIVEPNEFYKIGKGRLKDFDVRYSFAQVANKKYISKGVNYQRVGLHAISQLNFALMNHQSDMHKKGKCCVNSFSDIFDNRFLSNADDATFKEFEQFDAFLRLVDGEL